MNTKVPLFGLDFDNVTMDEALDTIDDFIASRTPHMIFCPNVALVVWARQDPFLRGVYRSCDLLPVDGMGVYFASHLVGRPLKESVSAVLMFWPLLERAVDKGYGVYLLGAKPEVLREAESNLLRAYAGLRIVGSHDGYFTQSDEPLIVADIQRCRPDILFLGMSSPKKEGFAARQLDAMGVPVVLGVGGTFDIAAGAVRLAPGWIRRSGLEWMYRLFQEPRRMWRRYLTTNTVFLGMVLAALLRRFQPHERESPIP